MATCSLFDEDEVYSYKPGKGYNFGIILQNYEFLSSDDEEEEEDRSDKQKFYSKFRKMKKGTVKVSWHPSGKVSVVGENEVHLADRSLMPGDVVRRLIPGQDTQCGFVMNTDVRCHVRLLRSNQYIYNVDSKDLIPLQRFEYGQDVLLDSWIGKIDGFDLHVILAFRDGARCQVNVDDLSAFVNVMDKRMPSEFSECPFYPGQELRGYLDMLSDAKWLNSSSSFNHKRTRRKGKSISVHVVVEKIVYTNVVVNWLSRGFEKSDNISDSLNPPSNVLEGHLVDRLKVLDWFSHCSVQIGDFMTYLIKSEDIISSLEPAQVYDPILASNKDGLVRISQAHTEETHSTAPHSDVSCSSLEKNVENADDGDYEDVEEGDASFKSEKKPKNASGAHVPTRKKRVVKSIGQKHKGGKLEQKQVHRKQQAPKAECVFKPGDTAQVEIELTTSWATVMWQDGSVEVEIPSVQLFPVHHLDDLEFFPGDFIVSTVEPTNQASYYGVINSVDHAERTCRVHWFKAYDVGTATAPTLVASNCEVSVYDIADHPDYKFRPGQSVVRVAGFDHQSSEQDSLPQVFGQIFEMNPNGHLVVKWADGSISQCYPQEVYLISEDMDDITDDGSSHSSWQSGSQINSDDSDQSWETESEVEVDVDDSKTELCKDDSGFDQDDQKEMCEHRSELEALLSRAETALAKLQKLLSVFDVSSLPVPKCFQDIIRIYRSCHDLDTVLQSTFFIDPELQSLISQVKKELRSQNAQRMSLNLSQLYEAWNASLPDRECSCTESLDSKRTLSVNAQSKSAHTKYSFHVTTDKHKCDLCQAGAVSSGIDDCLPVVEGKDHGHTSTENCVSCQPEEAAGGTIEQTMQDSLKAGVSNDSIDPSSLLTSSGAKQKKSRSVRIDVEINRTKRPKISQADLSQQSEARPCPLDIPASNHHAQDLCFKICGNLQKQMLKMHEEVNKRARKLLHKLSKVKETVVSQEGTEGPSEAAGESMTCSKQELAELESQLSQWEESDAPAPDEARGLVSSDKKPGETMADAKEKTCGDLHCSETRIAVMEDHLHDIEVVNDQEPDEARPPHSCLSSTDEAEDLRLAQVACKGFDMCTEVHLSHKYKSQEANPANPRGFRTAVRKELKLFQTSLPDGIFIKGFEDRMDLYSVMILGPVGTPYEDGLFLFDIKLPNDYPNAPPLCHYHSFCMDRLNPNLYEDGKVCVSLLGTWAGKGTEVWTSTSNLLQVLVSIQGLILVPEPYYNEAGYERQRGNRLALENSRMYNEMAILKTVQSLINICNNVPALFKAEITQFLRVHGPRMISRLESWMQLNSIEKQTAVNIVQDAKDMPGHQLGQNTPVDWSVPSCVQNSQLEICQSENSYSVTIGADPDHQNHTVTSEVFKDGLIQSQPLRTDADTEDLHQSQNFISEAASSANSDPEQRSAEKPLPAGIDTENMCGQSGCSGSGTQPSDQTVTPAATTSTQFSQPEFPLFPMSKGFRLTLHKYLTMYRQKLETFECTT